MDEFSPRRSGIALPVAVLGLGLVATVVGLLTVAGYAAHIGGIKAPAASTVATLQARSTLVLVESLLCLIFGVTGALCLALRSFPLAVRVTAGTAAFVKIAVLTGLLAAYWKPGWYFILDPNGGHPWAQVLMVFSGLQALALIATAVAGSRRDPAPGDPFAYPPTPPPEAPSRPAGD